MLLFQALGWPIWASRSPIWASLFVRDFGYSKPLYSCFVIHNYRIAANVHYLVYYRKDEERSTGRVGGQDFFSTGWTNYSWFLLENGIMRLYWLKKIYWNWFGIRCHTSFLPLFHILHPEWWCPTNIMWWMIFLFMQRPGQHTRGKCWTGLPKERRNTKMGLWDKLWVGFIQPPVLLLVLLLRRSPFFSLPRRPWIYLRSHPLICLLHP